MRSLLAYLLLLSLIISLTSGFALRRSGCPAVTSYNRCRPAARRCSFDVDCGGSMRCCSNGCDNVCTSNLAGLSSVFSVFYDPFSYAAFGPFRSSFWG